MFCLSGPVVLLFCFFDFAAGVELGIIADGLVTNFEIPDGDEIIFWFYIGGGGLIAQILFAILVRILLLSPSSHNR